MSEPIGAFRRDGGAARYFGVYPAIVTDIVDPDNLGRIQVKFPWLGADGDSVRGWATLLTPYADDDQGFEALPAVDTQVVVAFEAGNLRRPYIVGSAWNGREAMPEAPAAANNKRLIKSRAGSLLEFDDTEGAAKVTVSMKSGHKVILDDSSQEVKVEHANGCLIKFDSSGNVTITAVASMTINAFAGLTVNAPSATFSGSITCTALTATSITSPLYTPGAGNVW
ncbi:MAG TPA: phage baseplate assembly protein V [Pyrinomonadaceae bacterium]|nr:phage baseplate assembly protein V [Pyrinomonadaceae bacterium]